jgi:hypothetical protein
MRNIGQGLMVPQEKPTILSLPVLSVTLYRRSLPGVSSLPAITT